MLSNPRDIGRGEIRTCQSHRPYKRWAVADREVNKHNWEDLCHKCHLGWVFQAFRCGVCRLIHVGHSSWTE